MAKTDFKTIDEYISTFPEDVQGKLEKVRQAIRKAAPGAREELKWGKPAFTDETILVMFAAFKYHIGFYITQSSLKIFEEHISKFKTGKGSIQLPHEQPLPTDLIKTITAFRLEESKEGVKWKP